MAATAAPYVRLREHVFRATLTAKDDSSGEWRYAWTEQRFDVGDGTYSDAVPPRLGTVDRNYATDLRGAELPLDELYWMLLKGNVGGMDVYEVFDCCSGASFASSYAVTWTTQQDDYMPPASVSTIVVTLSSSNVSLTGVVLTSNQSITFVNSAGSTYSLLVLHQSTSSTSTNRVTTPTTQALTVQPGGSLTLWRDPSGPAGGPVLVPVTSVVPCPVPATQTATITTSQNDYPVSSGSDRITLALTSSNLDLTGLLPVNPSASSTVTVENSTSSTKLLTLKYDSASSSTGNRFDFPDAADLVLSSGTSVTLTRQPGASTKWKTVGRPTRKPWTPTFNGTTNNPAFPAGGTPDVLKPTLSSASTLTGFPASMPVGKPLTITNPTGSGYNLTISHAAGTSDIDFALSTGASKVLAPGESLTVAYDGSKVVDVGGSLSLPSGAGGVGGWAEATVAAAGSTQGTAAALSAGTAAKVTGAGAGSDGVILPDGAGYQVLVHNDDAVNDVKVYPPSGGTIGTAGTNTPVSITGHSSGIFIRVYSGYWVKISII